MLPSTTQLLRTWGGLAVLGLGQPAIALTPAFDRAWEIPVGCPAAAIEAPFCATVSAKGLGGKAQYSANLPITDMAEVGGRGMAAAIAPVPPVPPPETLALDPDAPEAMVEDPPQGAIAPTLDLDPGVIEGSPTLQRWLEHIPDVADDIRNQPSFRTRLRAGYAQFPSTAQIGGFGAAVEDVFVVPGTGLTASADYSRSWNGQREAYGGEARYYLLPLGGYVNIAPTLGYRSLSTPAYQTNGLDVGLRLLLVPSRGGGADLALSQRWVAPGSEGEVGITSLAIGYAVTRQLRLGTDFQLQNSRFGQDSRLGLSLELLL